MLALIMDDTKWSLVEGCWKGEQFSLGEVRTVSVAKFSDCPASLAMGLGLAQFDGQTVILGLSLSHCIMETIHLPQELLPHQINSYCQIKLARLLQVSPEQCLSDYKKIADDEVSAVACRQETVDFVQQLFAKTSLRLACIDFIHEQTAHDTSCQYLLKRYLEKQGFNLLPWREKHRQLNKRWFVSMLIVGLVGSVIGQTTLFLQGEQQQLQAKNQYQQLSVQLKPLLIKQKQQQALIKQQQAQTVRRSGIEKQQRSLLKLFNIINTMMPTTAYLIRINIIDNQVNLTGFINSAKAIESFSNVLRGQLKTNHVTITQMDVHPRGFKFNISFELVS